MKLIRPAAAAQLGRDLVDPLRHDQNGASGGLCEEIAQRPLEAPRQYHSLPFLGDECERALNLEDAAGICCEQRAPGTIEVT